MSQIMKALEQSEQSHQASFNRMHSASTLAGGKSVEQGWMRYLLAGVVLPLAVLIYLVFGASRQWQTDRDLALAQQEKVASQVVTDADVESLPYPRLAELKSLHEIQKELNLNQPVTSNVAVQSNNPEPQPVKAEQQGEITEQPLDLDSLDLSGLSPELAQRVQSAFGEQGDSNVADQAQVAETVKLTDNTARYRGVLPAMNLQTHMYASSKDRRWVKINGEELYEGDWLNNQIQLIAVEPRAIVIEYKRERIEIPALYEWNG